MEQTTKKLRMLICEDRRLVASVMSQYFVAMGFIVDIANSFAEVQRKIYEVKYDVIVCDTGYSECETPIGKTIYANKRNQFIPDLKTAKEKPINATTPMIINDYTAFFHSLDYVDRLNVAYVQADDTHLPLSFQDKTKEAAAIAETKILAANIGMQQLGLQQSIVKL